MHHFFKCFCVHEMTTKASSERDLWYNSSFDLPLVSSLAFFGTNRKPSSFLSITVWRGSFQWSLSPQRPVLLSEPSWVKKKIVFFPPVECLNQINWTNNLYEWSDFLISVTWCVKNKSSDIDKNYQIFLVHATGYHDREPGTCTVR